MRLVLGYLCLIILAVGCSSAQKKYDGKSLVDTSSGESKRPFWTLDGGFKIDDIRKAYGDDAKNPKFAYFISQASISKTDLIPNCYEMAKLRSAAEASEQISQRIKQAASMTLNESSVEFEKVIESQSKNLIVGSQVIDKTWFKVDSEEANPYKCFVLLSVPRTNLERIQQGLLEAVEKKLKANKETKTKLKESIEKNLNEEF